jgi:hypothetical protein
MEALIIALVVVVVLLAIGPGLSVRIVMQSLVEIGVDKNTTVVFPAPLMTTIAELGTFLAGEKHAAGLSAASAPAASPVVLPGPGTPRPAANGSSPAPGGTARS